MPLLARRNAQCTAMYNALMFIEVFEERNTKHRRPAPVASHRRPYCTPQLPALATSQHRPAPQPRTPPHGPAYVARWPYCAPRRRPADLLRVSAGGGGGGGPASQAAQRQRRGPGGIAGDGGAARAGHAGDAAVAASETRRFCRLPGSRTEQLEALTLGVGATGASATRWGQGRRASWRPPASAWEQRASRHT